MRELRLALHEAAHAIAAECLGVPVDEVSMTGTEGGCHLQSWHADDAGRRAIDLAGIVGEALFGELPETTDVAWLLGDDEAGPRMDLPAWFDRAKRDAPTYRDLMVLLVHDLQRALDALAPHGDAMRVIANGLMQNQSVSGTHIRWLLTTQQRSQPTPTSPKHALKRSATYLSAATAELWAREERRRVTGPTSQPSPAIITNRPQPIAFTPRQKALAAAAYRDLLAEARTRRGKPGLQYVVGSIDRVY